MAFGSFPFADAPFGAGAPPAQEAPQDPVVSVTSVIVTPPGIVIDGEGTYQFTREVRGENNPPQTGVWTTTLGTVAQDGTVTAPPAGLDDQVGTVTFTSDVDPTKSGSVTFAVPGIFIEPPLPVDPDRRFARPSADIDKGAWQPSAGNDLFPMLDSIDPDATYISTSVAGACDIALSPLIDPQTSINQVVRYQAFAPQGGSLLVEFMQSEIVIASWFHEFLPAVPTTYAQALTPEQCDSITDYTALHTRLTAA